MQTLLIIQKWQLRMIRNSWRQGWRERRRQLIQVVALGSLTVLMFFGSLSLFRSLIQATENAPPGVLANLQLGFLTSVALGMLVFLFMTGLRTINDTLFEAADLPFLLAQPISTRAVFSAKFFDSYLVSLVYIVPVALSVWVAFGIANSAPPVYYPLAVFIALIGTLLYHSVVVMLLLIIMRFVPGHTMKQLFMALTGLAAIIIVIASQVFASRDIQQSLQDTQVLFETVGQWGLSNVGYLPHVWMTKALVLPFSAFSYSWTESLLLLTVAAFAAAALSVALADRLYARGWGSNTEATTKKRRATRQKYHRKRRGPFWAIVRKDIAMFRRDPLLWYHFVVGAIVIGFFFYNASEGGSSSAPGPLLLIMPVFMAAVSSTQLGGIGISREGGNWQLIRIHLLDPEALFWGKLFLSVLPPVAFVTLAAFALELTGLAPYPLPLMLAIMWTMSTSVAAVQILLDILAPDFNLKIEFGASRKNRSGTGKLMISMVVALVQIIILFVLTFVPHVVIRQSEIAAMTVALVLLVIWTVLTCFVSYKWGMRRLHQLFSEQ